MSDTVTSTVRNSTSDRTLKELYLEACKNKDIEKVKACIVLGVDVNGRDDDDSKTPALFRTCELECGILDPQIKRNYDLLQLLLSQPTIDVNAKNDFGQTILMVACIEGRKDIVKRLCHTSIDFNCQDEDGSTAAICAVESFREQGRRHLSFALFVSINFD